MPKIAGQTATIPKYIIAHFLLLIINLLNSKFLIIWNICNCALNDTKNRLFLEFMYFQ
jgi:hypothetical protein